MKKEYIEKEKAVGVAHNYCHTPDGRCCGPDDVIELYEELKALHASDVSEVRHAYWRDIQPPDQDNNVQCWCSACGAGELHADGMIVPYCWKCGAKMDGGVNDAAD